MPRRKKTFDQGKGVRKLARERVGTTPPSRPLDDKLARKKPKHKKPIAPEGD